MSTHTVTAEVPGGVRTALISRQPQFPSFCFRSNGQAPPHVLPPSTDSAPRPPRQPQHAPRQAAASTVGGERHAGGHVGLHELPMHSRVGRAAQTVHPNRRRVGALPEQRDASAHGPTSIRKSPVRSPACHATPPSSTDSRYCRAGKAGVGVNSSMGVSAGKARAPRHKPGRRGPRPMWDPGRKTRAPPVGSGRPRPVPRWEGLGLLSWVSTDSGDGASCIPVPLSYLSASLLKTRSNVPHGTCLYVHACHFL